MEISIYTDQVNGVPYAPDFMGNRDLKDEEQLLVYLVPLTNAAARKWQSKIMLIPSKTKRGSASTNKATIDRKIFLKHVVKIVNCVFIVDGERQEIKDVEHFYDTAPKELIDDIVSALEDTAVFEAGKKTA